MEKEKSPTRRRSTRPSRNCSRKSPVTRRPFAAGRCRIFWRRCSRKVMAFTFVVVLLLLCCFCCVHVVVLLFSSFAVVVLLLLLFCCFSFCCYYCCFSCCCCGRCCFAFCHSLLMSEFKCCENPINVIFCRSASCKKKSKCWQTRLNKFNL